MIMFNVAELKEISKWASNNNFSDDKKILFDDDFAIVVVDGEERFYNYSDIKEGNKKYYTLEN